MNYRNIIIKGTSILKKNSILTAGIDAELLLSKTVKKSRESILLNLEEKLNFREIKNYNRLIKRRKKKEPLCYITGKKFFWKYEFKINKDVLIPRFDTEILVQEIIKICKFSNNLNILDIGLGSGCILISLLKEHNNWHGTGIDISRSALKIAKTNAKIQQVQNRIKFINSDIDNFFTGKYDLIVSNPPYINNIDYNNLDVGIKSYEPKMALSGGIDGIRIIEKVIKKSRFILKHTGLLVLEIGFGQHYKVSKTLKDNGFFILNTIKDLQNIRRCIIAKKIK